MLEALILFSSLVGIVVFLLFIAAIAFIIRDDKNLKKFRSGLVVGQLVTIVKDTNIFKANIVSITPTYVRVIKESGGSIGVNYEDIYPNNYYVDDDYHDFIGKNV